MSQHNPYDLELLWEKTNDGLDFFRDEFSSYAGTSKGLKGFSLRDDDKTGSCYVSKPRGSKHYLFTDFGANNITPDQKGINAIEYVIRTRNIDFLAACAILFNQFLLPVRELDKIKPEIKFSSDVEKELGYWNVEFFDELKNPETLKRIVPFYTNYLLSDYDFKQIKSYESVGEKKGGNLYHLTTTSTPEFPIYGYDKKEFVKIYQPYAPKGDKYILKHGFVGAKTERPIYGWDRLFDLVEYDAILRLYDKLKEEKDPKQRKYILEEIAELQLDNVIIATGGTDGLNIASLGYDVIWFNSETEIINSSEYYKLSQICKTIYYCPDLDNTGVKQAVAMGMKFLKIKMIWLPDTLKEDNKKDVADWVRKHKSLSIDQVKAMFKQLLSQALEFQFWEWNDKRGTYSIHGKIMLNFLKYNGFYIYKIDNNSADSTKKIEEKVFVRVQNNVATQVFPSEIKGFVLNWLEENFIDVQIYNVILKSVFFSERSSLMSLPMVDLNTRTGTKESQIYFFENKVVRINKQGVDLLQYSSVQNVVWESNVIKRSFSLKEPFFDIKKDENGDWDIEIKNDASNYLKVLIQTSRVYWQKDIDGQNNDTHKFKIESDNLTPTEVQLQKLQLINKIFCIGHLMHKYKIKSKSYLVLGIDRKIGKNAKDNKGGSGKSFIIETLFHYLKNRNIIDGRSLNKNDEKFILDGVTKETDLNYWEDLTPYFDFNSLFNHVTGEIKANHKGGKIYTIPFMDFAKTAVTMNAVPYDITDSLRRRLLTYECSDYYHEIGEEYNETRTIATDFGKDLFDENYSAEEWNNDDNFVMQCLKFYLNVDHKIEVSQGNLMTRNLIQQIGEPAMKFFTSFFDDKDNIANCGHMDNANHFWIYKKAVFDQYKEELGQKAKSSQEFKDILDLYCKFKKWGLEFKKKKIDGTGNSVEHFSIDFEESLTIENQQTENETLDDELETDLPF